MAKNFIARFRRDTRGAALAEYGLLLGLIAVASILVVTALGDRIADTFDNINEELADTEAPTPTAATTPAD